MSLLILNALQRLDCIVCGAIEALGRFISWLCLLMMLSTCVIVILRYGFGIGSIALQESVTYLHGTMFMIGTAVALKRGAHVRVDIFYRRMTTKNQAIVDLAGGVLFLLPLCVFMVIWSWDYVLASWQIRESSADADGLPAVFLLKTLIPITAVLLFFQGLAEIARCAIRILDLNSDDPRAPTQAHQRV